MNNQQVKDVCTVLSQCFGVDNCLRESFRYCRAIENESDDIVTLNIEAKSNECLNEIRRLSFLHGSRNIYANLLLIKGDVMGHDLNKAIYLVTWEQYLSENQ